MSGVEQTSNYHMDTVNPTYTQVNILKLGYTCLVLPTTSSPSQWKFSTWTEETHHIHRSTHQRWVTCVNIIYHIITNKNQYKVTMSLDRCQCDVVEDLVDLDFEITISTTLICFKVSNRCVRSNLKVSLVRVLLGSDL